ncbi:beta-lactamase family protein [Evansella sp. LMS18]|uniref:serine hydrolase domain-containing protein n=1 Tax=Evansella sp. LMS18 TaxID=2924033 RepID=UPI0020D0C3F7|nr:serine hydrolase domain-containing protein [Evansella sp. LMS18]UTR10753.1 beta-lactamase family protein [Evansella sp. LMS18]
MNNEKGSALIEKAFQKQFQKERAIKSAYLLVDSEKLGIHINTATGGTETYPAHKGQANYMASVGKIFTAVLIGVLYEQGKLSFDDPAAKYLDKVLISGLHVYKGKDYTDEIKIKHLLNHSSGLYNFFWPLLDELMIDPSIEITPQEAVIWGKNRLQPHFSPGEGFQYSNANYHLLGLIAEEITKMPFHEAMEKYIFKPNNMNHSFILNYSSPMEDSGFPVSSFYHRGKRLNDYKGYAGIDYASAGVAAPNKDLLKFMRALTKGNIIRKETLYKLMNDKVKYSTGIDYGYGIMQFKPVFLLMPKNFSAWGHAGATGAYMFYHPETDAYIIGTFNDFSYEKKGVRFMLLKVISTLSKIKDK